MATTAQSLARLLGDEAQQGWAVLKPGRNVSLSFLGVSRFPSHAPTLIT